MTVVAVTGATGFLGRSLIRALEAPGIEIRGLSRPGSNRELLSDMDICWIEGDVEDPASLVELMRGADWIIHAAGMLGQAGISERAYYELHVNGTENVLQAAGECRRILYISSPGVLGPIEGPPADENSPLAPSNPYERSKAVAERVAIAYARKGLPVVIGRPEFVYGPGDLHVLGLFQAVQNGRFFYVSGGNNTCHPTFINDAVDGLVRCLQRAVPGEIYHIAGPRAVSFRELVETIAAELDAPAPRLSLPRPVAWLGALTLEAAGNLVGRQAPLSRSGVAFFSEDRRFSWQKAKDVLGYQPKYDLETGVGLTVAWYRERGLL